MKKNAKKKTPKIDILLDSILNLEKQIKELSKKVEQLQLHRPYYPPEQKDSPKYWPIDYPKYKDVTWDAIDQGLQ